MSYPNIYLCTVTYFGTEETNKKKRKGEGSTTWSQLASLRAAYVSPVLQRFQWHRFDVKWKTGTKLGI